MREPASTRLPMLAAAGLALLAVSPSPGAASAKVGPAPMTDQRQRPTARRHVEAKITVRRSEAAPYDRTSPALTEIRIAESFTGGIEGESAVRALQVQRPDRSASLVSLQRFQGRLGGRQGAFVLQGAEVVTNGKIKATWFVVPGSGTGALAGLRGEGGFEGAFGKSSVGTLDYWFE